MTARKAQRRPPQPWPAALGAYLLGRAARAIALVIGYAIVGAVVLAILMAGCDALGRIPPVPPGDYVPATLAPIDAPASSTPSADPFRACVEAMNAAGLAVELCEPLLSPAPRPTARPPVTPRPVATIDVHVYDCAGADPYDPEIDPETDCEEVTP